MHEARTRQALSKLSNKHNRDEADYALRLVLIACGYQASWDNLHKVRSAFHEHVALFAPKLDNFDLQ